MKTGILGFGEIGKAIYQIAKESGDEVFRKDLDFDEFPDKLDLIHVCIPYLEGKLPIIVNKLVDKYNIGLVIIHSTVRVGTTKEVKNAVHSPVRGVHPNLYEGIKTFVKYIGSDDKKLSKKTEDIFKRYGIKYKTIMNSKSTELNKMLDTTYYGICIEAHRYFKEICDINGVDFETVKDFNRTYNEGYRVLGKENVVRPVLDPPKGVIGGHCVLQNARILEEQFKNGFLTKVFGDQLKDAKHLKRS